MHLHVTKQTSSMDNPLVVHQEDFPVMAATKTDKDDLFLNFEVETLVNFIEIKIFIHV